ncbi:hypothetical protein BST81_24685 [Leptolyngbya sp. 'hensonii']|uniref:hypothetical protein n=1 Tax=Leptolyngbya sp. 'hensonii' TaxID=1922337 RepID=UPI0009501367|nr:hypothetical protein [Leptolyngbya sp. 'hensonii']OLP15721.1 hypothetical protein BST81_24685 [Leptolyngbya sp. 'hensonii']
MVNWFMPTAPDGRLIPKFLDTVDRIGDQLGLNVPPIADLDALRHLPPGTLGRTLADGLDQAQLAPFTTGPRRKQLHDAVHVLTGYSTDPIGEAEVQAFLLGAKFHPAHILLGLGILHLLRHQAELSAAIIWTRLGQAYQRGLASHFDVDRWHPETQWHLPLAEVQALYRI